MAGPTPVSALIHAATMVTAGVYLIARLYDCSCWLHPLWKQSPGLAWLTLLLAGFAALAQHDIKRILAYSTISQIGYMFLAWVWALLQLGHLPPGDPRFFQGIAVPRRRRGHSLPAPRTQYLCAWADCARDLPVVFWSFIFGSAALAALPFTSGFYSKDAILLSAWTLPGIGPWLWAGGLLGALLTSIYSFRLVFVVFFGEATH